MAVRRYSPQREMIRRYLMSTDAHPSAETVYTALKPQAPGLSLGTVYRNLNLLADEGEILRLPLKVERFDADTRPHAHFVCSACDRVLDLELDYDAALDERVRRACGCTVSRHDSFFYGLCPCCNQSNPQS